MSGEGEKSWKLRAQHAEAKIKELETRAKTLESALDAAFAQIKPKVRLEILDRIFLTVKK